MRLPFALFRRSVAARMLPLAIIVLVLSTACTPGAPEVELGWSAPAVDAGSVFIGTRSGRVFKLNTADVTEAQPLDLAKAIPQWQFPVGAADKKNPLGAIYGRPEVTKDAVYIALNNVEKGVPTAGVVSALDRETGSQKWSYQTAGRVFGSPVLAGKTLYVGDDAGSIYALEASTGNLLWKQKVAEKQFWTTPAVSLATATTGGDTLFVGNMDHRMYALNTASGQVRWTFQAEGAIASKPLVLGDSIYFGAFDRKLYRVNAATGAKIWAFEGDGWFWNDAIATGDGSTVLAGSLGSYFYALDAQTGAAKWSFNTDAAVRAAPVLVGNLVYVVAKNGRTFVLDSATGEQRRSAPVLGAEALASPAWTGGYLYVHDMKEKLHKISAPA